MGRDSLSAYGRARPTLRLAVVGLLAVMVGLVISTWAGAAPGTDADVDVFDQCANGQPPSTSTACPDSWINGILNSNNSHYAEDDVTPQRVVLELPADGPTTGRTIEISYLTRKSGVHAYDSLATWNHTQTTADRCADINASDCVPGPATTFPIPLDGTVVADANGGGSATSGHQLTGQVFTMYGGTITGVSSYTHDDPSGSSDSYAHVTLTYSVPSLDEDAKVMLLFGGHIAPSLGPRGWGVGVGASSISGGPYHIRITAADGASVGNRDNQIMSGAILAPANLVIEKVSVGGDGTFGYTATGGISSPFSITTSGGNGSQSFTSIEPKAYTVTESAPPGDWEFTSLVCQDEDNGTTVSGATANIDLDPDETVTCTYTNTKPPLPTLDVTKDVTPASLPEPGGDFTYTVTVTNTSDEPVTIDSLVDNVYGTLVGDADCQVGTVLDPDESCEFDFVGNFEGDAGDSETDTVTVCIEDDDENNVCDTDTATVTITDVAPTLDVTKDVTPVSLPEPGGDFTYTVTVTNTSDEPVTIDSLVDNVYGTLVGDADCQVGTVLDPDESCEFDFVGNFEGNAGDSETDTVTVCIEDNDENNVCDTDTATVTLTANPGTVIVKKVMVGGTGSFVFTGTPSGTISVNNGEISQQVAAGLYTSTETVPEGWVLTSINCDDPTQNSSGNLETETANFNVAHGETVKCTFTNTKQPTLTVIKTVVNDNGGTAEAGDFPIQVTGNNPDPANFDGEPSPGTEVEIGTGPYNVTESEDPAYAASYSAGCSGDLEPGDSATCTITNNDVPPKLTLVKVVINNNGGTATPAAWTLTASGPTGFSGPGPSVSSNAQFDQGQYNLSEAGPVGYTASGWVCVDNNSEGEAQVSQPDGDTVNVGLGDDITCTITNDDTPATLIVIKNVINDNGGTAVAGDFQITINGVSAQGGNSFPGQAAPGTSKTLTTVGSYTVTETLVAGYTQTGASTDCAGTIALGQTKTCTITNNDNPPQIQGQGAIDVQKTASPTSVKEPGGLVTFSVTVRNTSDVQITVDNVVDSVFGDLDDQGGNGCFDVPFALNPSQSANCTFDRQVTGTGGTSHVNVVTVEGHDGFGHNLSDQDDARVDITPRLIDLVIVKEASSPTPLNGIVNYSMTVTNRGQDPATNVQLADPAPTGIVYLSANPSQGTCNLTPALITCSLGTINPGQTVTIAVTGRATQVGTHTNVATVTGGGGRETNPADNVDDAVTVVPAPQRPPTTRPQPPAPVCLTLTVSPKMIKADGKPDTVRVLVTAGKKRVRGTKVSIFGSGVRKTGRSNSQGMAVIRINPRRAGLITITAIETNQRVCGPKRIGVVGVFLPPLTG